MPRITHQGCDAPADFRACQLPDPVGQLESDRQCQAGLSSRTARWSIHRKIGPDAVKPGSE